MVTAADPSRVLGVAWLVLCAVLMSAGGCAQSSALQLHSLFRAAPESGVACYRIPVLVTAPNGDLIAAIDERVPSCADLKGNPNINIVTRRSEDGGRTWSEIERVVDLPLGTSASDPSMIVDRETDVVWLFYNVMDLEAAPDVYRFHVIRSDDSGRTWGAPTDITSQITLPDWHDDFMFITSGRGIQTQSGILLHTLVNLDKGLHLFGSRDHGASWSLFDTPLTPGDESKVVELANGDWMVNSRVNGAGMRTTHTSTDGGATWSTRPEPQLVDPGVNASLIRHPSAEGRLLFANAASADERKNLTLRQSDDDGETWTVGRSLYAGSAAYVSLTVLADGTVGVLFEKDGYSNTVFARFPLDWITDE